MSNPDLIIEERSRDIGDFLVGRLLPFRKKRMVGPFIFIDHMGPCQIGPGTYMDIDQHPHIGLSTLTYLMEGEIHHRDSIGTDQIITPGSVNFMTAGRGVTHTERTPQHHRDGKTRTTHGYQIWVALLRELEQMEPEFHHIDEADLPQWNEDGASLRLIAGQGFGKTSPLKVYSDLFMVDINTTKDYQLEISGQLEGEIGVCIVEGSVTACDQLVEQGNMLVSKVENNCQLHIAGGSQVLLFGGRPFEEERHIYWNFVASDKETIEEAKERWVNKDFPKVPNDNTYIPLPG